MLDACAALGHRCVMAAHLALRALKDGTRDLHARAELHVRILDEDAGIADYARYLIAMRDFHAAIETRFAADRALAAAGYDCESRRKSQLITQDLRKLEMDAPCAHATPELPRHGSVARELGVAYVLEGATLGGKYILTHLPPQLAALRGQATAFLDGYGALTGARWREFCSIVERVVTDDLQADAIAAARDTFACLIAWLARFESADPRRGMAGLREAS